MVEQIFIAAARDGNLVELTDYAGHRRIAEPYMVYISSKGKRLLHFYQRDGFSVSNQRSSWKNPEVGSFMSVRPLTDKFLTRNDYNPANRRMFPMIVFARPKSLQAAA